MHEFALVRPRGHIICFLWSDKSLEQLKEIYGDGVIPVGYVHRMFLDEYMERL